MVKLPHEDSLAWDLSATQDLHRPVVCKALATAPKITFRFLVLKCPSSGLNIISEYCILSVVKFKRSG